MPKTNDPFGRNRCKLPDETLEFLRAYIKKVEWRFAKTMPQWPHWYTVEKWNQELKEEFDFFYRCIVWYGYLDPFNPRDRWYYLEIDGFRYWSCAEDLINRADANKMTAQVREEGKQYKLAQTGLKPIA